MLERECQFLLISRASLNAIPEGRGPCTTYLYPIADLEPQA